MNIGQFVARRNHHSISNHISRKIIIGLETLYSVSGLEEHGSLITDMKLEENYRRLRISLYFYHFKLKM
jgi:hypothetical protein